jgi:uridylate kinase
MKQSKHIVISLGGSLIVPDKVDTEFLKAFKSLIVSYVEQGFSFVIITGGGRTARVYQEALEQIGVSNSGDLDWVGIGALRLNAILVSKVFGEIANSEVVNTGPDGLAGIEKSVIICGAEKPGSSTDFGAINFALKIGAKKVINLSNIDYAYDSDPKTNPNAKKLENVSWKEYRSYIPNEWKPGLSTPFDPVASKAADENGIEVAIMNGKNLGNLKDYLDGKVFVGTIIK